ncbi:MAG: tetratricopeptide repeat protein [Acidobacteria bacterium]|nr:tetratricopeptide repeat protein [Acidobacteriota bacterium]MYG74238.1 tetratricopeptide repeat protein [Acidobacteriota bacterium]
MALPGWSTACLLAAGPLFAQPAQPDSDAVGECEAAAQASDWDAAVTVCEEAIRESPDTYGIHYFLGFAYQARQEWTEAGAAFQSFLAAVEDLPEDVPRPDEQLGIAVRSAGLAWFRAGDLEAALPFLHRTAEADPADAEVHFLLGVGLMRRGDGEAAEAAFSVVIREAPQISQALFFAGQLRYETGDYEAAGAHLTRYLEAAPAGPFAADAHWMAGSIALRRSESETADPGADDEARNHFAALLAVEPESPRAAVAHYFLGTIAADREACDQARRHYEDFLRIAPDHERASEVRRYLEEGFAPCPAPAGNSLNPRGLC